MKILAIESSGLVASAAIATEDTLLAEYTVNFKKTHSQTLLPMVEEIVKMTGMELAELDAIAVSAGPGSFTGLRIGSATAKGLGLALHKPVVPVPTTQGIAANLYGTRGLICPLMDARRNQVYTGLYRYDKNGFEIMEDQMAVLVDEIIEKINAIGEPVTYLGDGVEAFSEILQEKTTVPFSFAPLHLSKQRAGALAVRAVELYKAGRIQTAAEHEPDYLRLSQAERELAEKQQAEKQGL
ncbi:MAG: tRNA (adenosine(37)-N6)-threonylcarbamoyltransferase complex dimerization subunit type 1 TsaB [Lachnospiraceae bacterium]|nr:tRNA (adenosine(37)-N6)-threonylcarbamoyltransferase complex dimerization subunit type 1 TsaB [Lachnospiraceae bacterium]